MRNVSIVLSILVALCLAVPALAVDKAQISQNVNAIVQDLDAGKDVVEVHAEKMDPYAFVMQEDGVMLAHPTLLGKSLKEAAEPVYQALLEATPEGIWVEYEWQGKVKNTFARKTASNLIVGSGY